MRVIIHMEDEAYAARVLAEEHFYAFREKINEYAKENNLSDADKKAMYEYVLKHRFGKNSSEQ